MIKPGDFVIMQFGHNDGGNPDDPARHRASLPGSGDESKSMAPKPSTRSAGI